MQTVYSKFITTERRRPSKVEEPREIVEETTSDRSRVIFSSAFRRLQQKAQVFSLESNASVRSRLTHTMEVSVNGRWIASKVAESLEKSGQLDKNEVIPFINIVETACLLHDIGNPPFGHFGESAIQRWFKENAKNSFKKSSGIVMSKGLEELMKDFEDFDGNPQGFRIVTVLQQPPGPFDGTGLNLLKCQLFTFLKYLRLPQQPSGPGILKKAGYFNTERHIVDDLKNVFSHQNRFPLTYLMEAADDISYCLSDIEDGIEKGIFTIKVFFEEFRKVFNGAEIPFNLEKIMLTENDSSFFDFKVKLATSLINSAASTYVDKHAEILVGTRDQLFSAETEADRVLSALKRFSSKKLFRSREAEDMEIAGYNIIFGLIEKLSILLDLSQRDFKTLVDAEENPKLVKENKLEIEWRFFNTLPKKYVKAYLFQLEKLEFNVLEVEKEWYLRAHLIVDFISGMTDNFSLELYKLFHGIETR